jgi:hypothetical protein
MNVRNREHRNTPRSRVAFREVSRIASGTISAREQTVMTLLSVHWVTMRFDGVVALDRVSFDVE